MRKRNSSRLIGFLIIFLILLSLPLTVFLSKQKQDLRKRAQVSSITKYGVQADMASSSKIPNSSQFQTLNPSWVRFVYKSAFPMPVVPSNINQLVIFNNESAEPAPIGSQDINQWKSYTDNIYIPKLNTFLANNPNTPAIEIWNEEDICPGPSFCPGVPDSAYAYLLRQSSLVIKTANANIKVVMGGLASGNLGYVTNVKNTDPNVFLNVDGLGLHPYGKSPDGWCAKGTDPGCNGNELPFGDLATSILDYKNISSLPVWVTEIGQGTDDKVWQAEYLKRIFSVLSKPELQVPMVNWYAFIDTMTGGNGLNNWGLFDSSGNIKPSGEAFSLITASTSTPTPTPQPTNTPTPTSDIIKPTVYITYPLNGAIVAKNKTTSINATATDNVRVIKVEFYINNVFKYTDTTSPYSYSWRVPNRPKVTYTITAKAYDAASNVGSQTITVTSK